MPRTDFDVIDNGSLIIISPNTDEAIDWVRENVADVTVGEEECVYAERRYAFPIMVGISESDLTMSMAGRVFTVEER